ncbi:MAG: hypothetical protein QOK29_3745, partial [Rhodospirillaceae bacterium]|nr:hypothetical protein [Rhodospirillaceae bacterium]
SQDDIDRTLEAARETALMIRGRLQ